MMWWSERHRFINLGVYTGNTMAEDILFGLFAKTPPVRIFLFMLPGADTDYSLSEIARGAELSLSTANRVFPELINQGYIINTRKVGKSILYQLNLRNVSVANLIENYNKYIKDKLRDRTPRPTIEEGAVLPIPPREEKQYGSMRGVVIAQSA